MLSVSLKTESESQTLLVLARLGESLLKASKRHETIIYAGVQSTPNDLLFRSGTR